MILALPELSRCSKAQKKPKFRLLNRTHLTQGVWYVLVQAQMRIWAEMRIYSFKLQLRNFLASVKALAIEQIALRVVLNQYNPQPDFSRL